MQNGCRFIVTLEIHTYESNDRADMEGHARSIMIFGLSLFSSKHLRVHHITIYSPCLHKTTVDFI